MATHRALTKDDEATRQEVRALDGDRDRHTLVAASEIVFRSEADPFAAVHVHRVVGNLPAHLRHVIFEHGRRHRGFLATIDSASGHRTRRIHGVGEPDHACDDGLDALEAADRHVELAAKPGVGARRPDRRLRSSHRVRGQ